MYVFILFYVSASEIILIAPLGVSGAQEKEEEEEVQVTGTARVALERLVIYIYVYFILYFAFEMMLTPPRGVFCAQEKEREEEKEEGGEVVQVTGTARVALERLVIYIYVNVYFYSALKSC